MGYNVETEKESKIGEDTRYYITMGSPGTRSKFNVIMLVQH
jgi:hypothetical protein